LLAFLRAAAEQDDQLPAVFPKIHPVARTEVDFDLMYSAATLRKFETFPCAKRVKAITTFAAATAFKASNHLA
jgi:hypothetical protein